MKTNRSYHILGEAVVFGTLSKDLKYVDDGENIHIYNHSDSDKLVEGFREFKSIKIKSQLTFYFPFS